MFHFLLLALILPLVSYVFTIVYRNQEFERSKKNLPPGSFGWPFLGESLSLVRAGWDGTPERFVRERIEKHGSPLVFKTSLLGYPMAVLCGPAGNKFLFANENKLVALWWPSAVHKIFGRCLITVRGDEARWMRKMMLSYLSPDTFASQYAATMDVITRHHIQVHWRGWEGTPERFVQERVEKHGSPLVFKTSLLGDRVAVLCGPAGNKFLFANENKLVAVWWPSTVRKLFGRCLITIRGDEAKWMRKMLLSYLGPDAFASHYAATMDAVTRRHIDVHWRGKEEVNVFQTVKLYAFDLACRLFLSLEEPNHIAKLGSLFNIFLKGIIELPLDFPGTRFYSSKKAAGAIRTELMAIIKERRVALEEGKASSSQDLLSHLLTSSDENGRYLTEMEIANNILLLLFAGHDTSTVSITLVMKSLGEHPDVYEKVLKEQMKISKGKTAGEMLKWEDIQKMKYSWNVVCEVMRITPPVTGSFREALVDFEYAGYTIPKGWKLYWSGVSTHKDEANFEDVTRFDPSRFEGTGPSPFTFVPFGGGPRMCLGKEFSRLEVLVFVHNIVTNFKWDLLIPDEKIEYDPMATPIKGLPVRLYPHQV